MRDRRIPALIAAAAFSLAGCVGADIGPINAQTSRVEQASPAFLPEAGDDGSTVVGLAFSGGGTRAAAFGYGVLRELDDILIDEYPRRRSLVDNIRMISGASGGAVAAAYFGYRGRDGYRDFRERFLLKNAESGMKTAVTPGNLFRALNGGINNRSTFAQWLDRNLFDGATFENLKWPNAPIVWVNASDIYNRTPFLFSYDTFAALCSSLDDVKLADAVAASAAVPVVFSPVVVSAKSPDCGYVRPKWLERALADKDVSVRLQAYAKALDSYQNADALDYVKLLDGGLTDNIGVTGLTLERASSETPYGPLSPSEAVKLSTLIFIVADAGREQNANWAKTTVGPRLPALLGAVSATSITSSVRDEFDALKLSTADWQRDLVQYRCGLPAETVRRYRGSLAGWNCRDVQLVVEQISFADLEPAEQAIVNLVPTRLKLPPEQVDATIAAARNALRANANIQAAIARVKRRAGVGSEPRVALAGE